MWAEPALRGADFAVLQFEGDGALAGDFVGDFGGAESDEDVVVAMAVQQGGGVGSDFYLEDADVLIL